MVSIRRRKLKGPLCNERSPSLVQHRSILNGGVPQKPEQSGRPVNSRNNIPSVGLRQPVKFEEERETTLGPPSKRLKTHFQVDPENPAEVHSYLMKLKEDNKLELGPLPQSKEMPVKEWMEKLYPQIFRVFPQNPRALLHLPDQSKQNEFLYCQYWLFLFELRNIMSVDYNVSPDYVESLGKVIQNLEAIGFDCRFMRSEMLVVGSMVKQRQETLLAERNLVAKRIVNFEKELEDLVRNNVVVELEEITPVIEMQSEQLKKIPCNLLELEYFRVVLKQHKEMLECKDGEGRRLNQVVEKISLLNRDRAGFSLY